MSDLLKNAPRLRVIADQDALAEELDSNGPFTAAERARMHDLGNPYAWLGVSSASTSVAMVADGAIAPASRAPADSSGVSQATFEFECRRIFKQYIPEIERGRLRAHHRSFIVRNRSQSSIIRMKILAGLKRYDLADIGGVQARFNRERDELTEKKLLSIETAALK